MSQIVKTRRNSFSTRLKTINIRSDSIETHQIFNPIFNIFRGSVAKFENQTRPL